MESLEFGGKFLGTKHSPREGRQELQPRTSPLACLKEKEELSS